MAAMCGLYRVLSFVLALLVVSEATKMPTLKMNNGLEMPILALGTYLGFNRQGPVKIENEKLVVAVANAIQDGYRHIDTASIYETEPQVGEGIKRMVDNGTVRREDVFVTTKLWNTQHKKDQVIPALKESLKQLGLSYVDLYLIHWPLGLNEDYTQSDVDYMETWSGMEEALKLGLTKSIGVSNFNKEQMQRVLTEGKVKPAALQIELNPDIVQEDLVSFTQSHGVVVMGYSPFGSLVSRFGSQEEPNPLIEELAKKYGKTKTQIALRYLIDRNIAPLPKTTNLNRLKENIDIFDFQLSKEDIKRINAADKNKRYTFPSFWQNHPYYPFEKVDNPIASPFTM